MTTARDLVSLAAKQAGILGLGQTLNAEDTNDIFTLMQQMIAQWQKKRWLVPSLQSLKFTTTGAKSYSVGIGGDINIQRPSDIKGAYVVQLNTGSTPVSLPLKKIFAYEDYIRISVKELTSLPDHFFYDGQYPLANLFIWPIGNNAQYEIHILLESLLGFGTTIKSGSITTGGAAYVDGIYPAVPLSGGSGTGASADITVTGGAVAIVILNADSSQNYAIGDVLSANNLDLGGAGAGFTWTVSNITSDINTEIVMPPEYEEALFLNLSLRVSSMYQMEPMTETRKLAKGSLNTLRMANTQVPTLTMPAAPGVRTGKAFNLYNPDC